MARYLKSFLRYGVTLSKSVFMRSRRFIRLTPWRRGKIWFFDKRDRTFFFVHSRGHIDSFTADQIFTNHDYDLRKLTRFADIKVSYERCLARKVPIILDCGGNIGLASMYFAQEFPEARIICVEPDEDNAALARANCSRYDNVVVRCAAVGSKGGFGQIVNGDDDANAYRVTSSPAESGLCIQTVQQLVDEATAGLGDDAAALFLVKIDIEGYESDLFSENTSWMEGLPLLIIELHDWMLPRSANSRNFLRRMSELSRDFVYRGENVFSIQN